MSGATSYNLYVSRSPYGGANQVLAKTGISGTSYTLGAGETLADNTAYRWTVSASNSGGEGPYSTAYLYFQVQTATAPSSAPAPSAPGTGSAPGPTQTTRTPTFSWSSVAGATSYNLYVSRAPYGAANQVLARTGISGTSYTLSAGEALADGTAHRWTVSASNGAGEGPYSTSYLYFQVQTATPPASAPALSAPGGTSAPGPTQTTRTPTFSWSSVAGASSYNLYVSQSPYGASNRVLARTGISGTSYTLAAHEALADNTAFRWTVSGSNDAGEGPGTTSYLYFQVQTTTPPGAPTPHSPGSSSSPGATLTTRTPTFSWAAVSGATSYNLYVSRSPYGGANQVLARNGITANSYVPSASEALADDTAYRWTVSATNGAGEGATSAGYLYFQVQTTTPPASAPSLSSPGSGSAPGPVQGTRTPTFSWGTVTGATSYNLYVSQSPYGAANRVLAKTGISGTSYTLSSSEALADDTAYRWTVTGSNSAGEGPATTAYLYFQVGTITPPTNAPVPSAPGSAGSPGATITTRTPSFSWSSLPGATSYNLYVSRSPYGGANQVLAKTGISGTTYALAASEALVDDTAYRWTVSASNAAGEGPTSTGYLYFEVDTTTPPSAPTLNAPGTSTSPGPAQPTRTPAFSWASVAGATSYSLYVSKAPYGVANQVLAKTGISGTLYTLAASEALADGTSYRWTVSASNGAGEGPVSTSYLHFRVETATTKPAAPTPVGPGSPSAASAPEISDPAVFSWNPVAGATMYTIQFSKAPYGSANIVPSLTRTVNGTSVTLPKSAFPQDATRYRWDVHATNGAGDGEPSSDLYVRTGPAPVHATRVPRAPAFNANDPLEDAARYDGKDPATGLPEKQSTCDPQDKPGVVAFRALVVATYPETEAFQKARGGGITSERGCTKANPVPDRSASEHREGRALDWMIKADVPEERAAADDLLGWLLENKDQSPPDALARRLGLLYVIWDRQIWTVASPGLGWQTYSGASPHTDHVHFSFSWAGARNETSFFTAMAREARAGPARLVLHVDSSPAERAPGGAVWTGRVVNEGGGRSDSATLRLVEGAEAQLRALFVLSPLEPGAAHAFRVALPTRLGPTSARLVLTGGAAPQEMGQSSWSGFVEGTATRRADPVQIRGATLTPTFHYDREAPPAGTPAIGLLRAGPLGVELRDASGKLVRDREAYDAYTWLVFRDGIGRAFNSGFGKASLYEGFPGLAWRDVRADVARSAANAALLSPILDAATLEPSGVLEAIEEVVLAEMRTSERLTSEIDRALRGTPRDEDAEARLHVLGLINAAALTADFTSLGLDVAKHTAAGLRVDGKVSRETVRSLFDAAVTADETSKLTAYLRDIMARADFAHLPVSEASSRNCDAAEVALADAHARQAMLGTLRDATRGSTLGDSLPFVAALGRVEESLGEEATAAEDDVLFLCRPDAFLSMLAEDHAANGAASLFSSVSYRHSGAEQAKALFALALDEMLDHKVGKASPGLARSLNRVAIVARSVQVLTNIDAAYAAAQEGADLVTVTERVAQAEMVQKEIAKQTRLPEHEREAARLEALRRIFVAMTIEARVSVEGRLAFGLFSDRVDMEEYKGIASQERNAAWRVLQDEAHAAAGDALASSRASPPPSVHLSRSTHTFTGKAGSPGFEVAVARVLGEQAPRAILILPQSACIPSRIWLSTACYRFLGGMETMLADGRVVREPLAFDADGDEAFTEPDIVALPLGFVEARLTLARVPLAGSAAGPRLEGVTLRVLATGEIQREDLPIGAFVGLQSPADVLVETDAGTVGMRDGTFTSTVPGAIRLEAGHEKWYLLPDVTLRNVTITGEGPGTYALTIGDTAGADAGTVLRFSNVTTSKGAIDRLETKTGSEAPDAVDLKVSHPSTIAIDVTAVGGANGTTRSATNVTVAQHVTLLLGHGAQDSADAWEIVASTPSAGSLRRSFGTPPPVRIAPLPDRLVAGGTLVAEANARTPETGVTLEWYLDDAHVGTGRRIETTSPAAGVHRLLLTATAADAASSTEITFTTLRPAALRIVDALDLGRQEGARLSVRGLLANDGDVEGEALVDLVDAASNRTLASQRVTVPPRGESRIVLTADGSVDANALLEIRMGHAGRRVERAAQGGNDVPPTPAAGTPPQPTVVPASAVEKAAAPAQDDEPRSTPLPSAGLVLVAVALLALLGRRGRR